MKRNATFFLGLFCLIIFTDSKAIGQTYLNQFHREKAHGLDLQGGLHLLNLCEKQPEYIQQIYETAFEKFETDLNYSFADLAISNDFRQLCERYGVINTGGPMLGNVTPDGVSVWVRTLYPTTLEVFIESEGENKIFGPVYSSNETDLTAIVKVVGLKPGTKYYYSVKIDGKLLKTDYETFFVTLPKEDLATKTNIAFGSCYHRWGLCNKSLSEQIISRNPLALLLNGDIAVQDRNNNIAMHRADYLLRDFHTAWKNLAANIPIYATWDDHDYFDDDQYNVPSKYTKEDKIAVCKVFRNSWNNPPYGIKSENGGVFFRTRIGPADVIMLDNRYFRERNNFLGDEQMKWLEEQLLDCKGPFIIISCGTMFSDYVTDGKDSWGIFDKEGRERLLSFIEKHHIGGVLLISGDRHGARGFKIPRPSGFNFYEFGAASLGGRVGPVPVRAEWNTQFYGISGEYAFGEFEFDATLSDPEVTFRLIHESGIVFNELTLSRSELTP